MSPPPLPSDGCEAHRLLSQPTFDDLFESRERATADEQDVIRGIDIDELWCGCSDHLEGARSRPCPREFLGESVDTFT